MDVSWIELTLNLASDGLFELSDYSTRLLVNQSVSVPVSYLFELNVQKVHQHILSDWTFIMIENIKNNIGFSCGYCYVPDSIRFQNANG
jgi:hypothetical protein